MTIRYLIEQDIDVDVCDDYDESCCIAFCGPVKLTEEGEREFSNVLDMKCELYMENEMAPLSAILHAENDAEVGHLREFFYSMAGYCADEDYRKWFKESDEDEEGDVDA